MKSQERNDFGFFAVLLLFLVLIPTSAQSLDSLEKPQEKESTAPKNMALSTYQDPKGRFSIQVPSKWLSMESPSGVVCVSGTGYVLVLDILSPEVAISLQTVKFKDKEILSQGPCQIGSLTGTQTTFKDVNPMGLKVIETSAVIKEKGVSLSFVTPENEYESSQQTLDQIFKSFQMK